MPSASKITCLLFNIVLLILSGCNSNPAQNDDATNTGNTSQPVNPADTITNGGILSEKQAKQLIELRAIETLALLSQNNMAGLVRFVHPDKGLRFSPYSYVQPDTDLKFNPRQIAQLAQDKTMYHWGSYDGSGDPIELTYNDYRKKFVTDKDYLTQSDSIGFNRIIGTGNSLNNRTEIYPNALIVEFYQAGKHPDYGGMDWGSLALVFEKHQSEWLLVAVIHNSWTS